MSKPSLLLFVTNRDLERELLKNSAINQFDIVHVEGTQSWVDRVMNEEVDAIIAQVDQFTKQDLVKLTDASHKILNKADVIFISSGEPNSFIDQAMLQGVSYHLRLPFNMNFMEEIANELYQDLTEPGTSAEAVVESHLDQFGLLVGSSAQMRKLYRVIRKAASSTASVLIVGESGCGKELVANTLHMMSERSEASFISINCGAISPELIESELFGHVKGAFTGATSDRIGVFEQADAGTLFLDEVTEMPIDHQVKLLRVLETGEYKKVGSSKTQSTSARIISATNREPAEAIDNDLFREDLYYRLAQFPIRVPTLRDRGDDIVGLAKHFLAHRNAQEKSAKEISTDSIAKIQAHDWPGNVRELMHAIERAFMLANDVITPDHLVIDTISQVVNSHAISTNMPLEEVEKTVILSTLEAKGGNKTEAAEQLGISVKTLYNKLDKYDKAED
ncbi:MAG: DNA-binding NtrC family response regulator [Pseudohongiellaceae bacterium]|jgi:DNA-binding NtrC family response regulator